MKKILVLEMGLLFLLTATSTFAQSVKTVAAPVTVTVEKTVVAFGNAVQISGTSVKFGDKNTVKISITKPDKSTVSLSSNLTPEGTYNIRFTDTKMTGAYDITAKSPDDKSTAKVSFRVISAGLIGETAKTLNQSLLQLSGQSSKIVRATKTSIDAGEDFSGRAKIDKDIANIDEALSQFPKQMTDINKALDELSGLIKQYPGLAGISELAEVTQELTEARNKADDMVKESNDLLACVSKSSEMSICDRMDMGAEALRFTGLVFNFITAWPITVASLMTKVGTPIAAEHAYNTVVPVENQSVVSKNGFLASVNSIKSLFESGSNGLKDYASSPTGLVSDAVQFFLELGFGNLCERFIGPIEGVLSVDATDSGRPFWGYKTHIKGRLILRFETKHNTGSAPVRLTGEFEGAATKFEVYEDLFTGNQTNKKSVLFHQAKPPIAAGDAINWMSLNVLGSLPSGMALPYYFKIPVTGALAAEGSSITIEVAPNGIKDFKKDLSTTAYYVSMPLGSMIPIVQQFDIPMQNVQFILSRGLRSPATIKVKTTKLSNGSLLKTIEQTFTREEVVNNGEVTVKWNLKVKACNPACP